MSFRPSLIALAAALIMTAGCAALKSPSEPPNWVTNPDFPRRDENYFYGAGQAPAEISNYFFRRDTARERARVDLARAVYDYSLEKTAGNAQLARAVTENTLPLHEIDQTWLAPDKTLHVLVRLSRKKVESALAL